MVLSAITHGESNSVDITRILLTFFKTLFKCTALSDPVKPLSYFKRYRKYF